jgi:hypothetical protein
MHSNIIFFYTLSIDPCANGTVDRTQETVKDVWCASIQTYMSTDWTMSKAIISGARPHKRRRHDDDAHLCCSNASPLQPHPPSCCTQQKNVTSVKDIETYAALHYLNRRWNPLVPTEGCQTTTQCILRGRDDHSWHGESSTLEL